jgi:GTPase
MQELSIEQFLWTNSIKEKRVGFVALIGRPNSWKSTFLNTLIWEKISIVSSVPQTTRRKVLGIFNDDFTQIIFVDTPWIHFSEKAFNQEINSVAKSSLETAQVILYFIDVTRPRWEEEIQVEDILKTVLTPVIRIYSKVDKDWIIEKPTSGEFIYLSSFEKIGLEEIVQKISLLLPTGPMLYPEEYYTSQDIYFRISEIIREKVFLSTSEEIPHSVYVSVEEVHEEAKMYKIIAYLICESESQKYILIWKWGVLIQKIATESRLDLESIFGKKVFLALRVKVQKNWRKDGRLVKELLN